MWWVSGWVMAGVVSRRRNERAAHRVRNTSWAVTASPGRQELWWPARTMRSALASWATAPGQQRLGPGARLCSCTAINHSFSPPRAGSWWLINLFAINCHQVRSILILAFLRSTPSVGSIGTLAGGPPSHSPGPLAGVKVPLAWGLGFLPTKPAGTSTRAAVSLIDTS